MSLSSWFKGESGQPKLNVLLVDDQATFRELLRRFLTLSGLGDFRFQEASDGAEAMKHFRAKPVDLVIMDQHMPGEDGIQVAQKMRAASGGRHVSIVFATGDGKVGVLEDAMDVAMADGFLHKPFSLKEFKDCLEPLLSAQPVN